MKIKHAQHVANGAERWNDANMQRGWDMKDAREEMDEFFADKDFSEFTEEDWTELSEEFEVIIMMLN